MVDICASSLINEIDIEAVLESEYPEIAVITSDCLSFCGMCAKRPFAIVNGKRIFAKTVEECLKLIKERIEIELSFYNESI